MQQQARDMVAANSVPAPTSPPVTPQSIEAALSKVKCRIAAPHLHLQDLDKDDDDDDKDPWGGMWDDEDPVEFSEEMQSLQWLLDTGFVSAADGAVIRQEILARAAAAGEGKAM